LDCSVEVLNPKRIHVLEQVVIRAFPPLVAASRSPEVADPVVAVDVILNRPCATVTAGKPEAAAHDSVFVVDDQEPFGLPCAIEGVATDELGNLFAAQRGIVICGIHATTAGEQARDYYR